MQGVYEAEKLEEAEDAAPLPLKEFLPKCQKTEKTEMQ